MNIPIELNCLSCGAPWVHRAHLSDTSFAFTCSQCGNTSYGFRGLGATVGVLILLRSRYELEIEKDYDMAIVLAAAALDCELSLLYCKWKGIEADRAGASFTPEDCEGELKDWKLRSIVSKITRVSEMLYQGGIEAFVANSTKWSETIKNGFPSLHVGSLAADFQKMAFGPRNRVLHQGSADHTEADASKCWSIAELGILILKEMDKAKLRATDL